MQSLIINSPSLNEDDVANYAYAHANSMIVERAKDAV